MIPGPAVPVEARDLRARLFSMSVTQHTDCGILPRLSQMHPIFSSSPAPRIDTEVVGDHEVASQPWQDKARSFLLEGGAALRRRHLPRPNRAEVVGTQPQGVWPLPTPGLHPASVPINFSCRDAAPPVDEKPISAPLSAAIAHRAPY
jgi:hypothetical protein